jgi:hypothetical protein
MDGLEAEGRATHAEVIVPLPGETFGSYIKGINALLDLNMTQIISHTLQMNHGTPYKDDPSFRKAHGFVMKYRIVPLDFSSIDGSHVFDVEEVAVASNTMSFEEYVRARKYQLVVDLCCNSRIFDSLRKYLVNSDVNQSKWIERVFERIGLYPGKVKRVVDSFESETKSELWDDQQELVTYYSMQENYAKLLTYERGGNVLYKHRIFMLSECSEEWISLVFEAARELLVEGVAVETAQRIKLELQAVKDYVSCLLFGCLSPVALDRPIVKAFSYDILTWLGESNRVQLTKYAVEPSISLRFFFSEKSIGVMRDAFKRYGTDLAGLAKLMQRVKASAYTRQVRYEAEIERESTA